MGADSDCGIYIPYSEVKSEKKKEKTKAHKKLVVDNESNVAIYQQQVYGNNVSPKVSSQLDKNDNQTFVSGTAKNKIVTTVMPVNSGIDSGNKGGSVKDRMSTWNQKKTKTNDESAENEQKEK